MTTYNGERHIIEQLESLVQQTVRPYEIIVIDDGSSDRTVDIAREFLKAGGVPFRVLVNERRLGPWENFFSGLSKTTSDAVAFCDQDDVWRKDKLEACTAALSQPNVSLVIHNAMITDGHLEPIRILSQNIVETKTYEPLMLDPYLGPCAGWGNCMVFKRSIATAIPFDRRPAQPGEDRLLSHDTWTYVLCAALGEVCQLSLPLTLYRQHGANVTESAKPMTVRVSDRFRDPRPIYRRRAQFYEECQSAFEAMCGTGSSSSELAFLAKRAARRYALRARFWNVRCDIYGAAKLSSRLGAYRLVESLALNAAELRPHLKPTSRLKDLANAVLWPRSAANSLPAPRPLPSAR